METYPEQYQPGDQTAVHLFLLFPELILSQRIWLLFWSVGPLSVGIARIYMWG